MQSHLKLDRLSNQVKEEMCVQSSQDISLHMLMKLFAILHALNLIFRIANHEQATTILLTQNRERWLNKLPLSMELLYS